MAHNFFLSGLERNLSKFSKRWRHVLSRGSGSAGLILLCLGLSSCAQQADLVRVQKEFQVKTAKLDREKKELEQTVQDTSVESQKDRDELKSELAQLLRQAEARLNSKLKSIREEILAGISSDVEIERHRIDELDRRLDEERANVGGEITQLRESLEQQGSQQSTQITALDQKIDQQFTRQGEQTKKQMENFQRSFVEFKQALEAVKDALGEEKQRATQKTGDVASKLESTSKANTEQFQKVNQSLESMKQALNESTRALNSRLDSQREHVDKFQNKAELKMQTVEQDMQAHGNQLKEVIHSITQIRDVLATTGTTLGQQVDKQTQQVKQMDTRLEQLETETHGLDKNIQSSHAQSQDLIQSMTQLREALASTGHTLGTQSEKQAQYINTLQTQLEQLEAKSEGVRHDLESNNTQLQALTQSMVKLQEALAKTGSTLGKQVENQVKELKSQVKELDSTTHRLAQLEQHQKTLSDKLETDTQALRGYLEKDVQSSIRSVVEELHRVNQSLSVRLQEQERQFGQSTSHVQESLTQIKGDVNANVGHMNELTRTVGQLREVVASIGTKMGKRVDKHDEILSRLVKDLENMKGRQKTSQAGKVP